MMHLVLGSASPRRKEILSSFNLSFEQITPQFDESSVPYRHNPREYAREIALGKAYSIIKRHPQKMILAADTIVFSQDKIYGKPKNKGEAAQFLQELSGKWHSVFTAVALLRGDDKYVQIEETKVLFNELTERQIDLLLKKNQWKDKAAGYSLQMPTGIIVRSINGSYTNVLGLPVEALCVLLSNFSIDLWDAIV